MSLYNNLSIISYKAREFGVGPLFDTIPLLLMVHMLGVTEDQEHHLLVKVLLLLLLFSF